MTRDELISAVALRMDEVTPENEVVVAVDGADNNPLYALILGLIDEGVMELFSIAPYWRIPQTPFTQQEVATAKVFEDTAYERTIIRLKVNDSFLRVAEIDYEDFRRPITEVFSEQSPEGKRQHNPYLCGKLVYPVAVMSHGMWDNGSATENCREIDCYSLKKGATLDYSSLTASYISKPATAVTSSNTTVPVPTVLIPALEWLIASRAFGARGDTNHAAICHQYMQESLV